MYLDPTYILVIVGMLLSGIASLNVSSTFNRYSRVGNARGITAERAAVEILRSAGIYDVRIEAVAGNLSDHYSPDDKVLRLSSTVYGSSSVAAIGVAAHECGHAIQHAQGYGPLMLRSAAVPVANIGSKLSWPIILIGLLLGFTPLAKAGVFLFLFVVLFQLITLPVEFNASSRAIAVLEGRGLLAQSELGAAKKVLTAAALTYVAALFSTVLQLLRLVMIVNRGSRRN